MKRAMPMPRGARKVPRFFSTASMRIVMTRVEVMKNSIQKPRTTLAPPPRVAAAMRGPGVRAWATPAPARAPAIWVTKRRRPRTGERPPRRVRAKVTAGLKRPPDTRKKTKTETESEAPNAKAM
jgi:hypothetical protein